MYTITFYSFKGGVGRTMALVNVAAELALRGKKVLIVDFDLEAPGIGTYEQFKSSVQGVGLVDYVQSYIETRKAPDVRNYVVECRLGGNPIWLMPAGKQDAEYGDRLNSIDWMALYRDLDGYLMVEDLKQQWAKAFSFDYVLIDSRTGHTDVGGICTRQLPDANVLMFFPNEQNVTGLEHVVSGIRAEAEPPRSKRIKIHFCPSNVPDLDDEDLIRQRHLDSAAQRLEYREPASLIHHYSSLAFLDQTVFVVDKARTRLADEYRKLVDAVCSENLEDRLGALSHLERMRASIRSSKIAVGSEDVESVLDHIFARHNSDGEIAMSLAAAYYGLGNVKGELEALSIAISQRYSEMRARIRRASLLSVGQVDLAKEDLHTVIASSETTVPEFISAISRLREIDGAWLGIVAESKRIKQLSNVDISRVSRALIVDGQGALVAANILMERYENDRDSEILTDLLLALIGSGAYEKAIEVLGDDRRSILSSQGAEQVFNFACAEWGQTGIPPSDVFQRVLELGLKEHDRAKSDPNFLQCLALASFVVGFSSDSLAQLEAAAEAINAAPPAGIFSCWRYLYVTKKEFASDIELMRLQVESKRNFIPEFLQRQSLWLPVATG